MKRSILLFVPALLCAQVTVTSLSEVYRQFGITPQKFFGTAAPGSVAGNFPGDLYTDTTAHKEYFCNAPVGSAAPACTTVSSAGWVQMLSGTVAVATGGTGLTTLTAHAVQVGAATSALAQVGPNSATTYPLFSAGASADPSFRAISITDLPATAAAWKNYVVTKIANGAGGCANAAGCWSVNGGTAVAADAQLTQDIVLFQLPANGFVDPLARVKTATACTGATTALITDFGLTGTAAYYKTGLTYDIAAAVTATNLLSTAFTALGADTAAATNVTARITTSVANVDQLVTGCSVSISLKWGVTQ